MRFARFLFPALVAVVFTAAISSACDGGGSGGDDVEDNPFGLTSEVVAPAANSDAMQFAPDGRLFFVEHWTGDVRIVENGQLLADPFVHIDDVWAGIQVGLTGLALDPDFATNHFVYLMYTKKMSDGPPVEGRPLVVRFTDSNNKGIDETTIIDDLPSANDQKPFNANGSLHFGPDGYLYLTLGDYDEPAKLGPSGKPQAQDLSTPIGKMLRVNKEDGTAPASNPFVNDPNADPRIYAYGFRAAFNFTWNPTTNKLYGTDSTGNTCEGVNIIVSGGNYGWPNVGDFPYSDCALGRPNAPFGYLTRENLKPQDFDSTVGAMGMEFISGAKYPMLGDSLVVCEARTQLLRRLVLTPPNLDAITANDVIARNCWLDVTVGPDGLIYYSNLTEIRKLVPPAASTAPSPSTP